VPIGGYARCGAGKKEEGGREKGKHQTEGLQLPAFDDKLETLELKNLHEEIKNDSDEGKIKEEY
jgi:hypothetical protein